MGHSGRIGEAARAWAARPSPLVRIGQGEGAGPLPPLSPLSPPPPILFQLGKGGVLLPEGVGLLLARLSWTAGPPPLNLYIRRQGHPLGKQVDPRDHILSRVQCPPPP